MGKKKTAKSTKKGGGGKLARSEVVQVRLDPKLKFAAELAARRQRRTLSSFIEWCISEQVDSIKINPRKEQSISEAVNSLWYPTPLLRLIAMGAFHPYLLNHLEEELLALIEETELHWLTKADEEKNHKLYTDFYKMNLQLLEEFFPKYEACIKGDIDERDLIFGMENAKKVSPIKFSGYANFRE